MIPIPMIFHVHSIPLCFISLRLVSWGLNGAAVHCQEPVTRDMADDLDDWVLPHFKTHFKVPPEKKLTQLKKNKNQRGANQCWDVSDNSALFLHGFAWFLPPGNFDSRFSLFGRDISWKCLE